MTYEEFWEEFKKDLDVWNMNLDTYQYYRNMAYKIWSETQK